MKAARCIAGRVFVLRLEEGDRLPDCIENFARENGVLQAHVTLVGGIGGGRIVVGPAWDQNGSIRPLTHELAGVHEAAGVGTLFPDEEGRPVLHMHAALGREGLTRTGCVRTGVVVWTIAEAVVTELLGGDLVRKRDPATGFELLEVGEGR